MSLFAELKQRNVFRVAAAYLVLSWLLLQVGDVLFEALGVPGWGIKLVLGLLALGFVPVLAFSWAYEITPEGLKKESEVDRSRSITPATGRKLDLVTIALVVLAVGFALLDRLVIGRSVPATSTAGEPEPLEVAAAAADADARKSIAVLPFSSFSDDPENAYFASGVHEDILIHLAKIHGLRVISRSSVERYAEARPAIPEIARALRVGHILEGSVRRAGSRVRVSAQLIDATTDEHLWAENFDRDLDDVFVIQSEIARHIAGALKATLSEAEQRLISKRPTTSIEAYDLFVRGREILRRGDYGQDKYIEAEPLFQRAVELDPEFVLAWTRLAEIHGQAVWLSTGNRESRTEAMKRAIARAVELAPEQPEVLAIQGEYHYRIEQDYESAAGYFERAHARLPGNPDIASQMGMTYRRLGRWDEAVARFEQATELDPASLSWTVALADTLVMMHQWDRAIAVVDPLLREYPDASALAAIKGWALLSGFGRIDAARDALAGRPASSDGRFLFLSLNLPLYARDFSAAEAVLDRPKIKPFFDAQWVVPYREVVLAMIRNHQGLPERAQDHLRRARQRAVELVESGSFSYNAWTALALAQAQLGESDQALVSINRAMAALAATVDRVDGPSIRLAQVEVLARAGQVERALDELDRLIGMPGGPSRWDLALNPQWDFLREHPRFAEMTRTEASLGLD